MKQIFQDIDYVSPVPSMLLESFCVGIKYIDHIDEQRGGLVNFVAEANKFRFLTNAPTCSYPACTRSIFKCEKCIENDCCKIHHDWGLYS